MGRNKDDDVWVGTAVGVAVRAADEGVGEMKVVTAGKDGGVSPASFVMMVVTVGEAVFVGTIVNMGICLSAWFVRLT